MLINGPGERGSIPAKVKTQKIVDDATLLNIQFYKVRIKGKIIGNDQRHPLQIGVVAIEKEAFGLPSATVANLILLMPVV